MTTKEMVAAPKFGRAAEVRAASFEEADNSIEVIWTTGASVRRRDWRSGTFYNEILEVTPEAVRLDRLNAGAPLLDTHDDWSLRSVIGSVVPGSARLAGGKGYARVRLSAAPEDAGTVGKIKDGIIRNISVGYTIHKVEKTVKDDGTDEDWRVVDWEPMEISAVPIPADAGSHIRDSRAASSTVEILTLPTEGVLPRLQRRQAAVEAENAVIFARHASRTFDVDGIIARALDRGADADLISADFRRSLEAACRAASDHPDDPLAAAEQAWDQIIRGDDSDRGAAFAAAFLLASQ